MNARNAVAALAVLAALTLTGCAGTPEDAGERVAPLSGASADVAETPEPEEVAEPTLGATERGEVCDPSNLNDSICAAFYPDQVVLNLASRGEEPLVSMSDEDKIALAHAACEGGVSIEGEGNADLITTAGALAYCNELADPESQAYIAYYQGLGEAGAKADFADRKMPQL